MSWEGRKRGLREGGGGVGWSQGTGMGGETFFQWSPNGYLGNGDEIRSLTPSTFVRKKASAVSRRGGGRYIHYVWNRGGGVNDSIKGCLDKYLFLYMY